jgi:hypothetical protein
LGKMLKKEILLISVTALVIGITVYNFKKPELTLPYPNTHPLPSIFNSLICEEVSETYMRSWPQDSDLINDPKAKVTMSLHEEKTTKWESSQKDKGGNWIDTSKIKKATLILTLKDNKVIFTGDNLFSLDKQNFDITINNQYRLAGALTMSKEELPRYDLMATFMLDKNTGLLILTNTNTMITVNESFGSGSRLFTCQKND